MCAEVMKPVGPILQKLLKRWPKLVVQLVYLFLVCTLLLFASAVCARPRSRVGVKVFEEFSYSCLLFS